MLKGIQPSSDALVWSLHLQENGEFQTGFYQDMAGGFLNCCGSLANILLSA